MDYYMIADKKILAFEWGKSLVSYIYSCSKKYNIAISDLNHGSLPQTGFLFVLGVDPEWLARISGLVSSSNLIVIKFFGKNDFFNNRFIDIEENIIAAKKSIQLLSECGKIRPALFGIQKNDAADMSKADTFAKVFPQKDIYYIGRNIADTFDSFYANISLYDSVICSNDLIAVYLLKRLKRLDIKVPEKLFVTGNGNLWIGAHISPSITSLCFDLRITVDAVFQMLRNEQLFSSISSITITPESELIERETTGFYKESISSSFSYKPQRTISDYLIPDEALLEILKLDSILSCFSKTDITILKEIISGTSYSDIAERVFLSHDSIKYHTKKIFKALNVHNRTELQVILRENLIDINKL